MIVVATSRHHINEVFKFQKKKTALPAIQQEKIENSERDESRVDTKNLGGGGGCAAILEIKFHKMPTGPEWTSFINKHFDVPAKTSNRNKLPMA